MTKPNITVIQYVEPDISKSTSKFGIALKQLISKREETYKAMHNVDEITANIEDYEVRMEAVMESNPCYYECGMNDIANLKRMRIGYLEEVDSLFNQQYKLRKPVIQYLQLADQIIEKYGADYANHLPFATDIHELYYGAILDLKEYAEHADIDKIANAIDFNQTLAMKANVCFNIPISHRGALAMIFNGAFTPELTDYVSKHNEIANIASEVYVEHGLTIPDWLIPSKPSDTLVCALLKRDPKCDLKRYFKNKPITPKMISAWMKKFPDVDFTSLM